MSHPTKDRLHEVFNLVEQHVEQTYGIPVKINDVPSPVTGDLDGAEIHVDYREEIDGAVFILAHLFGHTVQWNLSERDGGGTRLELCESGFRTDEHHGQNQEGWNEELGELVAYLES